MQLISFLSIDLIPHSHSPHLEQRLGDFRTCCCGKPYRFCLFDKKRTSMRPYNRKDEVYLPPKQQTLDQREFITELNISQMNA